MAIIRGQYVGLCRGKHSAKHMETGAWAARDENGDLILEAEGRWMISTSDGFRRKETRYIDIRADGTVVGDLGSRFEEV